MGVSWEAAALAVRVVGAGRHYPLDQHFPLAFLPRPVFHPLPPPGVAAAAKSLQSCPILCDPTDGSPPGSPVPGILQARVLEWGAIAFSGVSVLCITKSFPVAGILAQPFPSPMQESEK